MTSTKAPNSPGSISPVHICYFSSESVPFVPYDSFDNVYDGHAEIARLIGPTAKATLGGGIVRYERVKTTWTFDFDEMIFVIDGHLVVTSNGVAHLAGPGDVLFFPKGSPIEYDVKDSAAVFYAEYPANCG